jgi:hypothetical protein
MIGCGFLVVHGLIFLFIVLFQCKPVALVYDHSLDGTCLDFHSVVFVGSILSIIEDVGAITLPIPLILKLHLKFKKKVQVILMMSVGLM